MRGPVDNVFKLELPAALIAWTGSETARRRPPHYYNQAGIAPGVVEIVFFVDLA